MVLFPGVKQAKSGAYYYDDNDVKMIKIPVGNCTGDYILTPAELKRYFGVDPARMGPLPEYLIAPHLDSTWNEGRSKNTGRTWWDITGEVVAYRPIEWVPIVRELNTIPYSHFEVEYKKTTTKIQTSELYGHAEASFTIALGASWKGIKVEASTTTSIEASYKTSTELHEEIVEKGKRGDVVIKELAMGMALKVKRVYERNVKLYLNDESKKDSLTWDGPAWGELWVGANDLRDVGALQFNPIIMSGSGYSKSLYLQVLPVFNADKKLTNMHLALSNKGWTDWYAYPGGSHIPNPPRVETIPLPDNKKPLVTFIAVN
ncbi:hypothetical protein FN846DRAFT_963280 [Sphaerosporella brunnea]|uniref:Uncharacterized protein n=1 Tax=Sphaerosporella brunnea TaxID=1250544 RepID=A0A5J5EMP6_9PEZI|nr:hypothetical protein FN846DRAFT_979832 [Sphaerosporella brunnea]KAA8897768.1 hypothetical protein FN846DRAFT_963280 [Sphaerosporella brunnea]